MNYLKIYNNLINFRLKNPPIEYFEKHHTKPKSLFPELKNDPNNIVKLTYKEHYLAHHLLYRYYKSINDKNGIIKMGYAWFRLCKNTNGLHVSLIQYKKARQANIEANKLRPGSFTGRIHSKESNLKNSLAHIGKPGPNKGKELSDETKRKISKTLKLNPFIHNPTNEQREKMSLATKNSFWCNDGIKNYRLKELPSGFKLGRLNYKRY